MTVGTAGNGMRKLSAPSSSLRMLRNLIFVLVFFFEATLAFAQGGPPYYTNDPGTPGHLNWEINLGYMPFYYSNQSVSHTPDLDLNFGVGDRIQLTYENAWLRVQNPSSPTKFGLGQSNFGSKCVSTTPENPASPPRLFLSSSSTTPTTPSGVGSHRPARVFSCLLKSPGSLAP